MADKFRKTKSNFATTLVTGIGTGTGDTITLNSTTGLPTDTEITLTFNRVTSGGVVNSTSVMERITGTISGSTLTSYTRGVDGTTEQAHAGGVVVEYIPNAADMNDQIDGILVGHDQQGFHKFNAPEGFLLNGKIVPSVTDNNLKVEIKGADGNDPSATNPVYVTIGGVVRAITTPMLVSDVSVAGTNHLNMGSAELATKEVDLFVYIGCKVSTDNSINIMVGRIPYANIYGDFAPGTTSYNSKMTGCSTGADYGLDASDPVVVIGRFAATLSAGPGYTWSVPTFTSINLIQRPIFNTRRLSYTPVWTGFSTAPSMPFSYIIDGSVVTVYCDKTAGDSTHGTSNGTGFTFTVPFLNGGTGIHGKNYMGRDNGTDSTVCALNLDKASATCKFYTSIGGASWTASGNKDIYMDNLQYSLI